MDALKKVYNGAKKIFKSKPNPDKVANVVVIGETGCGKSTFINYLTNYFLNGTLENLRISIPTRFLQATESSGHCEKDLHDVTKSKTDMCHRYEFTDDSTSNTYCFLDTPGLSDTRGVTQDDENVNKILDAIEQLGCISCVLIIVNGSNPRLTANMQNVLTRLRGNLPDVVLDSVIVVLTNVKRHETNFELSALQLSGKVYPYYMQNSAFSTDPHKWDNTAIEQLEADWTVSMEELRKMTKAIDTFQSKSVAAFKDLKTIRDAIKTLMHETRLEVVKIQKMQDDIAALEIALKKYEDDEAAYQAYTKQSVTTVTELVDAPYHSTMCIDCNNVCHDHCGLNETTTVGNEVFQGCAAMSNNSCTQCEKHCSYDRHYHARKTVQTTEKTVSEVLEDIKAKYDFATQGKQTAEQELSTVGDAKQMLQQALDTANKEIQKKCNELRKICSGFNIVDELYVMITQLQMEARSIKNVETRKQAEEFIRSLTEFCETLEKDTNKKISGPMKLQETYKPIHDGELPFRSKRNAVVAPQAQRRQGGQALGNRKKMISSLSDDYEEEGDGDGDTTVADKLSQILSGGKPPEKRQSHKPSSTLKSVVSPSVNVNLDSRQHHVPIQPSPSVLTADHMNSFTNHELLSRHTQCLRANDTNNLYLITNELQKRATGKSIGPLTMEEQRILLQHSKNFDRCDSSHLRHELLDLQESIGKTIENDIQQLASVSRDTLLKTAAAYTALMAAPSTTTHIKPGYHSPSPALFNTASNSGGTPNSHHFEHNYKPFEGNSNFYKPLEATVGAAVTPHQPNIGFQSYVFHTPQPDLVNQFQSLSLEEQTTRSLVDFYEDARQSHKTYEMSRISEELKRRMTGEKYGRPTNEEIQHYHAIESEYAHSNLDILQHYYTQLRDHIAQYIQNEPRRLLDVPPGDLLRISVLYSLVHDKSSNARSSPFQPIRNLYPTHNQSPTPSGLSAPFPTHYLSQHNLLQPTPGGIPPQRLSPSPNREQDPVDDVTSSSAQLFAMHKEHVDSGRQAKLRRRCGTKNIDFKTAEEAAAFDRVIEEYQGLGSNEIKLLYDSMANTLVEPLPQDSLQVKAAAAQNIIRLSALRHLMESTTNIKRQYQ